MYEQLFEHEPRPGRGRDSERSISVSKARLCSSCMADAKSPAAACSAARPHFCSHRPEGDTPGGGATKGADSPPNPAPPDGAGASAGSSRSCERPAHHDRNR